MASAVSEALLNSLPFRENNANLSVVAEGLSESFRRFGWFFPMASADFDKESLSPPFGRVGRLTPAVSGQCPNYSKTFGKKLSYLLAHWGKHGRIDGKLFSREVKIFC